MEKTEKSMTELNIEANEKLELDKITEAGKELTPLHGPGYVGLSNLGNSCYINSVLQVRLPPPPPILDTSAPSRPRSAPLLAPPLVPPEWTEERLTPPLASLSPLQVLAAVPEFGSYCAAAPQIFRSAPSDPTQDAVTQLAKVAEGLLTARYAADHHHRPIHRHRPFSAAAIITTTARCPA